MELAKSNGKKTEPVNTKHRFAQAVPSRLKLSTTVSARMRRPSNSASETKSRKSS